MRMKSGSGIAAVLLVCMALPTPVLGQDREPETQVFEVDEIIVQSTRSNRRVQDEPIRVEVIGQEEIEEKLLMRPGNISMLLAETGGLRVQVTSPALGSANIRVQGLSGRYTQLLADGLPLYGGQASSLGLLQIPPSDLGQVEVIKGSASALYGPAALGGVINLISRRPSDEHEGELILNVTSREGEDLSAYGAGPLSVSWSGSSLLGLNHQSAQDIDGDGWADMAGYSRWAFRPRLFWTGDSGATAFLTLGAMQEERLGGTLAGRNAPDGSPFLQLQDTTRFDGGAIFERPLGNGGFAQLRASAVSQDHRHQFGDVIERDEHRTLFGEASLSVDWAGSSWVVGAAMQSDDYTSESFPLFDYTFTTPALFVQVESEVGESLTLAASGRWDDHSEYGSYFSPRFSALYRPGPWTLRASWGKGFYAPTPFVEETEASGLSRLEPISGLRAETAQTASLDLGYAAGPFEATVTLFASDIEDAVQVQEVAPNRIRLVNSGGTTRTRGTELLLRYRWDAFTVTGSYVYVDASEPDPVGTGRRTVPLTPRQSGGVVAMWEDHDRGRIGLEAYYTGSQPLDGNPYRYEGRDYFELGALGEIVVADGVRVFLNLENLLNVRQTRYDPLLLPQRSPSGSWTVESWAPLEGFTINGGIRLRFGGH